MMTGLFTRAGVCGSQRLRTLLSRATVSSASVRSKAFTAIEDTTNKSDANFLSRLELSKKREADYVKLLGNLYISIH